MMSKVRVYLNNTIVKNSESETFPYVNRTVLYIGKDLQLLNANIDTLDGYLTEIMYEFCIDLNTYCPKLTVYELISEIEKVSFHTSVTEHEFLKNYTLGRYVSKYGTLVAKRDSGSIKLMFEAETVEAFNRLVTAFREGNLEIKDVGITPFMAAVDKAKHFEDQLASTDRKLAETMNELLDRESELKKIKETFPFKIWLFWEQNIQPVLDIALKKLKG